MSSELCVGDLVRMWRGPTQLLGMVVRVERVVRSHVWVLVLQGGRLVNHHCADLRLLERGTIS